MGYEPNGMFIQIWEQLTSLFSLFCVGVYYYLLFINLGTLTTVSHFTKIYSEFDWTHSMSTSAHYKPSATNTK